MMYIKSTAASAAVLALTLAASAASAKGHNQGATDFPGENVGAQTVVASQGEGAEQGNGKSTADTPAGAAPGKSGDAGKPQ